MKFGVSLSDDHCTPVDSVDLAVPDDEAADAGQIARNHGIIFDVDGFSPDDIVLC